MNSYIVSYDLRKKRNYEDLYEALKAYPYWGHVLESIWVIKTSDTAVQVRNHLQSKMDSDDGIIVAQSAHVAAWDNIICNDDWLKSNL